MSHRCVSMIYRCVSMIYRCVSMISAKCGNKSYFHIQKCGNMTLSSRIQIFLKPTILRLAFWLVRRAHNTKIIGSNLDSCGAEFGSTLVYCLLTPVVAMVI